MVESKHEIIGLIKERLDGNTFGESIVFQSIDAHQVKTQIISIVTSEVEIRSDKVGGQHPTGIVVSSEYEAKSQLNTEGHSRMVENSFKKRIIETGSKDWSFIAASYSTIDFERLTHDRSYIENCAECTGNGYLSCSNCLSSGKISCSGCSGSGRLTNKVNTYDDKGNFVRSDNVSSPCAACGASGRVKCNVCNGRGQITCGYCIGSGKQTNNYYAIILLRTNVSFSSAKNAPIYFNDLFRKCYNKLAGRRAFATKYISSSVVGDSINFYFNANVEVADTNIEIAGNQYTLFSAGSPSTLENSPYVLDDLHLDMVSELKELDSDKGGELYEIVNSSRVGEYILSAAASGKKTLTTGEFDPLLSQDMIDQLLLEARRGYRSIGQRMRKRSWSLFLLTTPLIAVVTNIYNIQLWADSIFSNSNRPISVLMLCTLPFFAVWVLFLGFTVLRQRAKTKQSIGESVYRSIVVGSGPWWSGALGLILFCFVLIAIQGSENSHSDLYAIKTWLTEKVPFADGLLGYLTSVKNIIRNLVYSIN